MNTLLLCIGILCLIWVAILGFGFVDDPGLLEDLAGWLGTGLAFSFASFLPWAQRPLR
jgi:hypothetical protein